MKLLNKKEIDIAKESERKRDIDEGLKLARRVDNLREIAAKEEQSLALFRQKTLKAINEDIRNLSSEKELLSNEVRLLRKEIAEGLAPLRVRREEIENQLSNLLSEQTKLQEKKNLLNRLSLHLDARELAIDDNFRLSKEAVDNANQLVKEALEKDSLANKATEQMLQIEARVKEYERVTIEQLGKRELQVSTREENQLLRDKQQDAREKELNTRETKLRDREQKLLRNLKLLKK